MPKITDNEDGTKSITINSNELRGLKDLFGDQADFKKVVRVVDSPDFKATLGFLKAVVS